MIRDKLQDKLRKKLDNSFKVEKDHLFSDYRIIFKETGKEVLRDFLDDYIFERIGEQQNIFDISNLVNDWGENQIKLLNKRK